MGGKTLKERMLATLAGWVVLFVVVCSTAFAALPFEFQDASIKQAVESGDTKTAIELLKQAAVAEPGYYVNYYDLGLVYFELEQYGKAAAQFHESLGRKGKHYPSMYYLGKTLLYLDSLDAADKLMKEGLKKAKDEKAWFENGVGLVAMKQGSYSDADVAFRKALAVSEEQQEKRVKDLKNTKLEEAERQQLIDSVNAAFAAERAEYHINLGDANFYQGIPSLAINEYEQALSIDTASTEVYYHWAEACLELKDYNCALDKLRVVLSKDSTHAAAWNRAGAIYFKAALSTRTRDERKQRFIEAIGSYKRYFELTGATPDSSTVRPYFETAMSYANIYGFEDAAVYFEKVLSIPYEPKDIYFYFGKSLWGIKDYVKAAQMLQKHEQWVASQGENYHSAVRNYEVNQLLGDCYFYRKPKDFSSAARYYVRSLEEAPDQKRVLQNTAIAYHSLKNYCTALEYYDKRIALGIDSTSVSILKNAGLCALNQAGAGQDEDDEFLDEFGDDMGGAATAEADPCADPNKNYYEEAVNYMKQYLDQVPGDTTVVLRIANTYLYQMQDVPNGVAYFQKLLTLSPKNCLAMKSLGYAYFGIEGHKDYTKALGYLKDAYNCFSAADGACSDVSTIKWIAQCYHLRGSNKNDAAADYKEAFDWYGKVLKCEPNDSDAKKGQDDLRYEF